MTATIDEYLELVNTVQDTVKVLDIDGQDMVYRRFDINRLR